jgi:hypothetical protein
LIRATTKALRYGLVMPAGLQPLHRAGDRVVQLQQDLRPLLADAERLGQRLVEESVDALDDGVVRPAGEPGRFS